MHTLCIGITRECNWNLCTYCHVQKDPIPNRWAYIQPVLDHVLTEFPEITTIKFFGGEPLLMTEMMRQVMEYVEDRAPGRMGYDINTNGLLMTEEVLDTFADFNVRYLLSVDGGFSTLSQSRRYGRTEFVKLRRALELLTSRGQLATQVQVNVAIDPNCAGTLVENIFDLYRKGVRCINLLPAFYVLWAPEQLQTLQRQFVQLAELLPGLPGLNFVNFDSYAPVPLFCDHLVLDVDGKLYPSMIIFEGFFRKYMEQIQVGAHGDLGQIRERLAQIDANVLKHLPLSEPLRESTFAVDRLLTEFVHRSLTPA